MEQENKVVVQLIKNEEIRQFYETELRSLELAAFSIVLSALRAQGGLTEKRKETIGAVKIALNISDERHRAEIRRVATDERLIRIAERVDGDSGCVDWNAAGYAAKCALLPHFVQCLTTRDRKSRTSVVPTSVSLGLSGTDGSKTQPLSPQVVEEPFDPSVDGEFLLENGWTSDSEVEMEFAKRIPRSGSDTEEQKEATVRAALAVAGSGKKRKVGISLQMRKSQVSPDITAVSPKGDESRPYSPIKVKKLNLSPVAVARGRKRKILPPVKATKRKTAHVPAQIQENQGVDSSTSSEFSYASITALASKLGISHGRGRGGKMITLSARASGRGRGGAGVRGIRKTPLASPRRKQSPNAVNPRKKKVKLLADGQIPNQPRKVNTIRTDKKHRKVIVRRRKKKIEEEDPKIETKETDESIQPNEQSEQSRAGALHNSFDDLNIDLQCNESINSPTPQPLDDDPVPLVNNNLEHFENYEVESRLGVDVRMIGEPARQVLPPPVPSVPVKPPRARAKGVVPAKMRHKANKNFLNHDDSNRQLNFQQPECSLSRSYTPLIYTPSTNCNPYINNFYNDLQVQMSIPGVNSHPSIRPRMIINPGSSSNNYTLGASIIPSSLHLSRSPVRNSFSTPVFSTTLNSNSLHKKRTQFLLPSTYQTQSSLPGDNFDITSATASSLAVAARNRSSVSIYDQQRLSLGINSGRPTTPVAQVQRKAQPHILSSSKLNRPLPTLTSSVLSSTTSVSLPVAANSLTYNPSVTTVPLLTSTALGIAPLSLMNPPGEAGMMTVSPATGPNLLQVQVPFSGNNSSNCSGVSDPTNAPSLSPVQNLQTTNIGPTPSSGLVTNSSVSDSIPVGLGVSMNMNVVRAQGGSNIIFLQKSAIPISSSSGAVPIVNAVNQTAMSPAVQGPVRGTSRAVILRRGNIRPGNVMFVDVHKNQLLGSSQVPQLLQTARLITGSSDLTMLNMPTIYTSSAGNTLGRKFVPSLATVTTTLPPTESLTKTGLAIDSSPSNSFRTVQQHQLFATKGIQVLTTPSHTASQDGLPINYLTRLPTATPSLRRPIFSTSMQQLNNSGSSTFISENKGIGQTIIASSHGMVNFENDIIHEEEVNTSAFIEYGSVNKDCVPTNFDSLMLSNNGSLLNASTSSLTDTASEGEPYHSPRFTQKMAEVPISTPEQSTHCDLVRSLDKKPKINGPDLFQTALKSSGINFTSNMDDNEPLEDQNEMDQSTNDSTSKFEIQTSTVQLIANADSIRPVKWKK